MIVNRNREIVTCPLRFFSFFEEIGFGWFFFVFKMSFGICFFFHTRNIFLVFLACNYLGGISVWFIFFFSGREGWGGGGYDGDFFEGGVLREQTKNEGLFFMINDSLKRDIIGSVFVYFCFVCLFTNLFVFVCVLWWNWIEIVLRFLKEQKQKNIFFFKLVKLLN